MACLLELERLLSAKDSVLERNTIHTLREYVAAGGKPETAIDLLSDNYRGARARACAERPSNPYTLSCHATSPCLRRLCADDQSGVQVAGGHGCQRQRRHAWSSAWRGSLK